MDKQSLVERAALTEIEIDHAEGSVPESEGAHDGVWLDNVEKAVADAQLAKALWILHAELDCVASLRTVIYIQQVKDWLREQLEAAGLERPQ